MKIFYWKESASQGLLVDPLLVAALPVGAAVLGLGKPKSDFLGSRLGAVRSVNQVATNLAQIYVSVSQKHKQYQQELFDLDAKVSANGSGSRIWTTFVRHMKIYFQFPHPWGW
jgi:hypothetical protein